MWGCFHFQHQHDLKVCLKKSRGIYLFGGTDSLSGLDVMSKDLQRYDCGHLMWINEGSIEMILEQWLSTSEAVLLSWIQSCQPLRSGLKLNACAGLSKGDVSRFNFLVIYFQKSGQSNLSLSTLRWSTMQADLKMLNQIPSFQLFHVKHI
jgi:hypothetical protein